VTLMDQLRALVQRAGDNLILVEDFLSRNPLVSKEGSPEPG
jgi:hypothetical protein